MDVVFNFWRIIRGLVYDPSRDEFFTASENQLALLNDKELKQISK